MLLMLLGDSLTHPTYCLKQLPPRPSEHRQLADMYDAAQWKPPTVE